MGKKEKGKKKMYWLKPQKKRKISDNETVEFIKTIKRSEYSIIKQLKMLPAQISILSLLLSSEANPDALLKI